MKVSEVIKLGQPNTERADAFIQDFLDMSEEHPINRGARIIGRSAIELGKFGGSRIHISDITSLDPGKGYGGEAMRLLMKLADKHDVDLELIAKAYRNDRMSTKQLVQWYQRLGFELLQDPEIDLDDGIEMRYIPK